MAFKSKYQLMDCSSVTDDNGNCYPDLATFPLNRIRITGKPRDYSLTQRDLYRFFDLCYEFYDSFEFYDYITLWLNDITDIGDEDNFDRKIKLYGKNDLDAWYSENVRDE